MSELLTKDEVAARLKVLVSWVERWSKEGKLKKVRLSHKAVRFHPDDVDHRIEQLREQNT
jgi:excisionase family DNA binding protein